MGFREELGTGADYIPKTDVSMVLGDLGIANL